MPKNCRNLSTSLKCFACIYYHSKKFLVESVYEKRSTLISLYIAHTLVFTCIFVSIFHLNYPVLNTKTVLPNLYNFVSAQFYWLAVLDGVCTLYLLLTVRQCSAFSASWAEINTEYICELVNFCNFCLILFQQKSLQATEKWRTKTSKSHYLASVIFFSKVSSFWFFDSCLHLQGRRKVRKSGGASSN